MRNFLPFVIAIAIFMSFFRLGSVTLFDVDEAVFAEATNEMVQSGNWITPTYNGENRYDKPIFFYWLMAASYKLFGINEFAARFPSAIASFLLALSVFFFVRHFLDSENALNASISLVLSVYFFVYSHAAVTDMTLTLFITLSLFSFYFSIKSNGGTSKGTKSYIYGFYLFSALAFLTKGLIGIVLPFGIAIIYLLISEGFRGVKKAVSLKGGILFLIISAPWYSVQLAVNGQEFIQQFFIKHHFIRYTEVISGHKGPIYYYIPVLILGIFPWIAFLFAGIRNAFKEKDKLGLFAFVWFAFVFVFFSFSITKLPNYILPAIPAVSILISRGMSIEKQGRQYANVFIAVVSVLIGIAFVISEKYLLKLGINEIGWTRVAAVIMFTMTGVSLYALLTKKTLYKYLSAMMIIFLFVFSVKALPIVNQHLQGTLYKYSLYAKERLHDEGKIIAYGINNPSIVFYSGHKVINTNSEAELMTLILASKGNMIAITKAKNIEVLKGLGFNVLEDDGRYAILEKA